MPGAVAPVCCLCQQIHMPNTHLRESRDGLVEPKPSVTGLDPVVWEAATGPVDYETAVRRMEHIVAGIHDGNAPERIWLLEHPALYTAGTSAKPEDLIEANRLPVFNSGRGGEYTYHGPGQRICYAMLDLNKRRTDLRWYVSMLEQWVINTLAQFNVTGERREDRVGVWVRRPDKSPLPDGSMHEDKIAAIGIRVRRWVTYHGISINLEPDLSQYSGIVPCGVAHHGVTSLVDLGLPVTMDDLDVALQKEFEALFGPVTTS